MQPGGNNQQVPVITCTLATCSALFATARVCDNRCGCDSNSPVASPTAQVERSPNGKRWFIGHTTFVPRSDRAQGTTIAARLTLCRDLPGHSAHVSHDHCLCLPRGVHPTLPHTSMSGADPRWRSDLPWNKGVSGDQVLPLINVDAPIIRVQAGPGTGKTFAIRRRVLRIPHPNGLGCPASEVLVCSFNRAIAHDLEQEIGQELAPYGLATPTIRTIHSLAVEFAGSTPRFLLPHEIEPMLYDVLEVNPSLRTIYPGYYEALRGLREHEAELTTHTALMTAARAWMADHKCQLIGDTPRDLEQRLRQGDEPKRRYRHVIVDEFQDLTEAEARLALRLRAADASFVALGDGKQSIYAFRGNAKSGLAALPDLVSPQRVKDLTMDQCQRCSENIVQLGNALMELECEPLVSVRPEPASLHFLHFKSARGEARGMARHILTAFRQNPQDRHLIMVTRRKWGYDLRNELRTLAPDVSTQTVFAEDILETWPARESFLFLSILGEPNDPVTLRSWVGYRTVTDGKGFKAAKRHAPAYTQWRVAANSVLDIDKACSIAGAPVSELKGVGATEVHRRAVRLKGLWEAEDKAAPADEIVESVLDAHRWVTYGGDRGELARSDMDRLRIEAKRLLRGGEAFSISDLTRALRHRIATREPLGEEEAPQIRIVTLWGAKGLTADHVYLCGLADEALPGVYDGASTGLTHGEWLAEQRRLLYVSLTRARKTLIVSRPQTATVGELRSLGMEVPAGRYPIRNLRLTRFLGDLDPSLVPPSVDGTKWTPRVTPPSRP